MMNNRILHASKRAFELWLKSPSVSDNTEFIDGFFAGVEFASRDFVSSADYISVVSKLQTAAKALEHYAQLKPKIDTLSCPIVVDVTQTAREALEKIL